MGKIVRTRHLAIICLKKNEDNKVYLDSYAILFWDCSEVLLYSKSKSFEKFYEDCCAYAVGKIICNCKADTAAKVCRINGLKFSDNKLFENVFGFIGIPEMRTFGLREWLWYFDASDLQNKHRDISARRIGYMIKFYRNKNTGSYMQRRIG